MIKLTTTPVKREILKELNRLSPELQQRVLDFARALSLSSPGGVSGKDILRFAGILTPEEAESMERAIEEGCERVDLGER